MPAAHHGDARTFDVAPKFYTNPHIEYPALAQSRRAMDMIFQG